MPLSAVTPQIPGNRLDELAGINQAIVTGMQNQGGFCEALHSFLDIYRLRHSRR